MDVHANNAIKTVARIFLVVNGKNLYHEGANMEAIAREGLQHQKCLKNFS
jgi:hypothetical protein